MIGFLSLWGNALFLFVILKREALKNLIHQILPPSQSTINREGASADRSGLRMIEVSMM